MTKRYPQLDYLKYIAAIFVVLVHLRNIVSEPYVNYLIISVFGRISVPIFFAISGFFFAKNSGNRTYLIKYTKRLLALYLFFSLLYLPLGVNAVFNQLGTTNLLLVPIVFIGGFLYAGTYYHLWYIPALLFALWFMEYLRKYFKLKTIVIISIILYMFGSIETYYFLIPNNTIKDLFDLFISLFYTTRNGLFLGLVFISFGYQVYYHPNKQVGRQWLIWLLVYVIEASLMRNVETLNFNFLLSLLPLVYTMMQYFVCLKVKDDEIAPTLANYATLIYFYHLLVMEALLTFTNLSGYILVLATLGLVQLVAYLDIHFKISSSFQAFVLNRRFYVSKL